LGNFGVPKPSLSTYLNQTNTKPNPSCAAFAIDKDLHLKDLLAFTFFLFGIDRKLCRKYLNHSNIVAEQHPLRYHSTAVSATQNKQFVDALDFIARCRGQPAGEVYKTRPPPNHTNDPRAVDPFDTAVIYVAFHQFFVTQKYPLILSLKRDDVNRIISDARTARIEALTAITEAKKELAVLRAAANAPEVPFDFSIPSAEIPALRAAAKVAHAAAIVEAERAIADAVQAEFDAAATIRLNENYCSYITHDSDRAREELRQRTADSRFCRESR
jgi:hypothetical protein